MRPLLIGLSHIAPVLKGFNALSQYHGFGSEESQISRGLDKQEEVHRRESRYPEDTEEISEESLSREQEDGDLTEEDSTPEQNQNHGRNNSRLRIHNCLQAPGEMARLRANARIRRQQVVGRSKTRLDFVRPQNLRRQCRQSYVGLGTGWDEYGSGRPADSWKNRMIVDLKK